MSDRKFKFNTSWIAIGILVSAFVISAVRFAIVSQELSSADSEGEGKINIRIAHWLLEPGVRESLQAAIDEYESLPHVKAADVHVLQVPISQRFFEQFMNVHLISGTAPDIAIKGGTTLIKGNALAKFYAPISSYINEPNPYNALEYQAQGLNPELSEFLAEASWKNTFFDGLQGGYEELLSDYYAIPISTWGGSRIFYNVDMLHDVVAFTLEETKLKPEPSWLHEVWRTSENPNGYLARASGIRWLEEDRLPETLGEFLFYCRAVQAYAAANGYENLVPIAGSRYYGNNLMRQYQHDFLSSYWEELDFEPGSKLHAMETISGYSEGQWDFDSPALKAYFEFMKELVRYYPNGFLGMDREQAQRRFVLGQAAMMGSGAWDAQSVYSGVKKRDDPADRFEVKISLRPLPTDDERWGEFLTFRISEADVKGQVPFAINKQTPHFDWCLDFLKFLTSHRINEAYNEEAGRLPVIIGAEPPEIVRAFTPSVQGIPEHLALDLGKSELPASIKTVWSAAQKSYVSGDIDYEEVKETMTEVLENPQLGIKKAWIVTLQSEVDKSRDNNRAISVERLNALRGSSQAADREISLLYLGLTEDEGVHLKRWWNINHPDEPYPSY
ncbi:ABC transporter substrate-binding protein [Cerasicoccus maritimus]|uniref:ABC transporter substrate-binding protein n=1 Tax=Cerasicoccus maritimus TaxID=490089 RepID=UPI0028525A73|nr:extracellular solute-binding protein [Cerasicoccus maritimus]